MLLVMILDAYVFIAIKVLAVRVDTLEDFSRLRVETIIRGMVAVDPFIVEN